MTRTANDILNEMLYIEGILNCPVQSKGKINTLKGIMRKLATQYRKAVQA